YNSPCTDLLVWGGLRGLADRGRTRRILKELLHAVWDAQLDLRARQSTVDALHTRNGELSDVVQSVTARTEVALVLFPPMNAFLSRRSTRPPRSRTVWAAERPARPPPTTIICDICNGWK